MGGGAAVRLWVGGATVAAGVVGADAEEAEFGAAGVTVAWDPLGAPSACLAAFFGFVCLFRPGRLFSRRFVQCLACRLLTRRAERLVGDPTQLGLRCRVEARWRFPLTGHLLDRRRMRAVDRCLGEH